MFNTNSLDIFASYKEVVIMIVTYKVISTGKVKTREFSSAFMCRRFINKLNDSKYELIRFPLWVLVGGK